MGQRVRETSTATTLLSDRKHSGCRRLHVRTKLTIKSIQNLVNKDVNVKDKEFWMDTAALSIIF